jgi:stage II sporulation protein M
MPLNLRIPGPKAFLRYVWDLRLYVLASISIFIIFFILGYAAAVTIPEIGQTIMSSFSSEVSPLKELSPLSLMLGIFANNAIKCLLVVLLGLAFGIVPAFFMLANGLILGIVIGVTMSRTGLLYVLAGTLPHGIIELPMVFISAAIGLKLGVLALKALFGKKEGLLDKVTEALLIYFVWIFPLLLLSAFVETFVTSTILYLFFRPG